MSDVPDAPRNLQAKDSSKKSCTLVWDSPKSDGGSPVTGYTVERRPSYSTKWMKVKDFIPGTTLKVSDLEEGEEYEFRVFAENKAGPGKASEPCGVVAKDPFGELILLESMQNRLVYNTKINTESN